MGDALPYFHLPRMSPARPTRPDPEHFCPLREPLLQNFLVGSFPSDAAPIHADFGGMIAIEEGGVDLYAAHKAAGDAKRDYHPVKGLRIVSPGFPPIVPGAGGDVDTGAVDGGFRVDEAGGVGEELVGEGEDAGAEGGGGEV